MQFGFDTLQLKPSDLVFILDVDGVVTDSKIYYNDEGKAFKVFGADDWDLLKKLSQHMTVRFITADTKGFLISSKRIRDDMGFKLDIVSNDPKLRWKWISENKGENKFVVFMGDGWADYYSLRQCYYGITTCDALSHVKEHAQYITSRKGAERAVAEAVLHLAEKVHLNFIEYD